MLKTDKEITVKQSHSIKGESRITDANGNDIVVAIMTTTFDLVDGKLSGNLCNSKTVVNAEAYTRNIAECREDITKFDDYVDSIIAEGNTETTEGE